MNNYLFDKFIDLYDDNTKSLKFNDTKFRTGAKITCPFGLAPGYTIQSNGNLLFDSIRMHQGVDRNGTNNKRVNEIIAPFDFDLALYINYGPDHVYGSILRLFNFEFQFEMRILHIYPNDIDYKFKSFIDRGLPIPKNTKIGRSGDYGRSKGDHTHTEFVSLTKRSEVLEEILLQKFPAKEVLGEYSNIQILEIYGKATKFKNKDHATILKHYKSLKEKARISDPLSICNKYQFLHTDYYSNYKLRTKYSSQYLFNGL